MRALRQEKIKAGGGVPRELYSYELKNSLCESVVQISCGSTETNYNFGGTQLRLVNRNVDILLEGFRYFLYIAGVVCQYNS